MVYKIFSIDKRGSVHPGAAVEGITLRAGIEIPAIIVGEQGRGRERGLLPVEGAAPGDTIYAAALGSTRAGRPKLIAAQGIAAEAEAAIVVCRVEPGYRGGTEYSGASRKFQCGESPWSWATPECLLLREQKPQVCPGCGKKFFREISAPAPGQVLVLGRVAQGDAGRMGGGEQRILLLPAGETLRIERSGRLYGEPAELWYKYVPLQGLVCTTPEEADLH